MKVMPCYNIKQNQNKQTKNPVNKLKENTVIGKEMRLIIGNKKIITRKIVKIIDIFKGMLTLQNLMKDQYLNCLYSNTKCTRLCTVCIVISRGTEV